MYQFLMRILKMSPEFAPLGRWGYHWEAKLKYQKYYD